MSDITITQDVKTTSTVVMPLGAGLKLQGTVKKNNETFELYIGINGEGTPTFNTGPLNKEQVVKIKDFLMAIFNQLPSISNTNQRLSNEDVIDVFKKRMEDTSNKLKEYDSYPKRTGIFPPQGNGCYPPVFLSGTTVTNGNDYDRPA